jgi:hypothetical protein
MVEPDALVEGGEAVVVQEAAGGCGVPRRVDRAPRPTLSRPDGKGARLEAQQGEEEGASVVQRHVVGGAALE